MELKVIVYRRPNMFSVQNNMYNLMGLGELEKLFTIEGYKTTHKSVTWFYPERFLNILEQRALVARAEQAGFQDVTIITHSVYIVQTVNNTNIGIVQDEHIPENAGLFKLSNDASGMPNDAGLGIIGGSICMNK